MTAAAHNDFLSTQTLGKTNYLMLRTVEWALSFYYNEHVPDNDMYNAVLRNEMDGNIR